MGWGSDGLKSYFILIKKQVFFGLKFLKVLNSILQGTKIELRCPPPLSLFDHHCFSTGRLISIIFIMVKGIYAWIQLRTLLDVCCCGKFPQCSAVVRQICTFNGWRWAVFQSSFFLNYFYTVDKVGILAEWISLSCGVCHSGEVFTHVLWYLCICV